MASSDTLKGFLFTAAGSIGWGISGVCSQYLFSNYDLSSAWLTVVRMLLSGVILLAVVSFQSGSKVVSILRSKAERIWLLTFAVLGLLLCQYTFMGAIKYANSATATILQSLNVVIVAVWMAVTEHRKMLPRQLLSVAMAVLGTCLIATGGNLSSITASPLGLIFGILSAVGVVSYTLLSRGLILRWGNLLVTGWEMLIGGFVLCIVCRAWVLPQGLDAAALGVIQVIAIVGTAGGFPTFLQGVKYIGPEKATLIGCLEPATATVLSALFLHTTFSFFDLTGFCMILATVFLSTKTGQDRKPVKRC